MNLQRCVIPAAGRGTRLLPATRGVPKPLLPVLDEDGRPVPVIQVLVREALTAGVGEVALVVAPDAEELFRRHFHREPRSPELRELGDRVRLLLQPEPLGFGHAVLQARSWVRGGPFLLLLADQLFLSRTDRSCAAQLADACRQSRVSMVGVTVRSIGEIGAYGVVAGRPVADRQGEYELHRILEKPDPERARRELVTPGLPPDGFLCLFGCYAFTPEIFDVLEEAVRRDRRSRGEIQLTDAMEELRRREGFAALEIVGEFLDTGTPEGYRRAFAARTRRP